MHVQIVLAAPRQCVLDAIVQEYDSIVFATILGATSYHQSPVANKVG